MSREKSQSDREELLAHAARCYRQGGLKFDACRCLERLDRYGEAAFLHEAGKRWDDAARCFEQAKNWRGAARCHLENNQPRQAARCLQSARDPLEAALVLAHLARDFQQARAILADLSFDSPEQQLTLDLVRGRCDLHRNPAAAGRAVCQVIERLHETVPGPPRERVLNWAFILAHEVLNRPDLTSALFAAMAAAGIPDARQRWEHWAEARLESVEGIFAAEEEAP